MIINLINNEINIHIEQLPLETLRYKDKNADSHWMTFNKNITPKTSPPPAQCGCEGEEMEVRIET